MIPLYHRGGPEACGMPALGIERAMQFPRYDIPADNVLKLDGTRPVRGEGVFCGACKKPIVPQWLYADPDPQPVTVR